MNKKEVLVEYITNINSIIKQSLHQTQRIKFTCFDLSVSYIVFGATSGGIYVFSRKPYKFVKIIPNKEGSVTNIAISPDEKSVGLSTIKGLIVIVENCFYDTNVKYQIYSQHEGTSITSMKWSINNLYSGDFIGRISVIAIAQLSMTKALFQTPSATLMKLDSSIVQLDTYGHYLLVSTKTRTYLCDTNQEQYTQVGKKLRDGNFGACFFYKNNVSTVKLTKSEEKTFFKSLKDDEKLLKNVRIYCARPGSRLWEANFEASVVCTHQFRDSLNQYATNIIHVKENVDSSLIISSNSGDYVLYNFNFEKIFPYNDYILTFKTDGIYIFDVKTASLLYWTNYFNNIRDVKIIGNVIYIWLENNILKLLSLLDIESFITKILSSEQYLLCAEFCKVWRNDISVLIDDNKLQVLNVLNGKIFNDNLLKEIEPLLKKIEGNIKKSQKLQSGIYVVDNVHHRNRSTSASIAIKKLGSDVAIKKIEHESSSAMNTADIKEESSTESLKMTEEEIAVSEISACSDKNDLINILNRQYQFNKVRCNMDIPKYYEVMQSKSLNELYEIYNTFLEYKNDNESKKWLSSQILRFISLNISTYFENLEFESKSFQFILNCFLFLNKADGHVCSCNFPLSSASHLKIQHYEIGCKIVEKHPSHIDLCTEVPYMFRFILEQKCDENLPLSLPLLMQYNDIDLLRKICKKFTYDMWDDSINFLIKLKNKICVNCDKNIDNKLNISWNDFSKCMLHSIGGFSCLELLTRHSHQIPSGELDTDFYQFCVFTSCLQGVEGDAKNKSHRFLQNVEKNEQSRNEFDLLFSKYLIKKQNGDFKGTNINSSSTDSCCPICDISLNSPLFEDNISLKCGHTSHKICAINRDICKNCYETV